MSLRSIIYHFCSKAWLWFPLYSLLKITEPPILGKQLLTWVIVHLHLFVHLPYPIVVLMAQLSVLIVSVPGLYLSVVVFQCSKQYYYFAFVVF